MRDIQCPHCESYINAREIVTRCPECKELINKPKTKTMNNFKKGDKVFVYPYGWCEFSHETVSISKVVVKQEDNRHVVNLQLLSFTEYKLEGLTQERPFEPVVGQMYYFWDDNMLAEKRVVCAFYKGYGNEDFPHRITDSPTPLSYQHISETNPLL